MKNTHDQSEFYLKLALLCIIFAAVVLVIISALNDPAGFWQAITTPDNCEISGC